MLHKNYQRSRPSGELSPPGGTPHMKGVWMLVVSLKGINFGFWSHLGVKFQSLLIRM